MDIPLLKFLCSKLYHKMTRKPFFFGSVTPDCRGEEASTTIYNLLSTPSPCMIARYGSEECRIVMHSVLIKTGWKRTFTPLMRHTIHHNAGFFPPDHDSILGFGKLMQESTRELDMLGRWIGPHEKYLFDRYAPHAQSCHILDIEPYYQSPPWSRVLKGKKILVIHPFTETIHQQYVKREHLFTDPDVLPEFELKTITAVQSIANTPCPFETWFHALDHMKAQIKDCDFDIALIGCGAYGFPLAAYVKQLGKKAIHMGGATQLLFGIKGKRWDDREASKLYNEYWVRPLDSEKVSGADRVEGGCYW